jgi:hypothetical protein
MTMATLIEAPPGADGTRLTVRLPARVRWIDNTSHGIPYITLMRRVVLDSSVVISAFRSRQGASFRLLGFVSERRLVPLATPVLLLQYEEVLKRPEQRHVSGLTLAQIDTALSALADAIEPVDIYFAWRPQLRIRTTRWSWTRQSTDGPMRL